MAKLQFLIEDVWHSFKIQVVDVDVRIFTSVEGMDGIGVYLNRLSNKLYHTELGRSVPVQGLNGICLLPVG